MLVRVLTALVLLSVFLAALLLLGQAWFSVLVGAVVALGANEWARLTGWRGRMTLVYAAACVLAWYAFLQLPALGEGLLLFSLLFWVLAVPAWLLRGWGTAAPALAALAGLAVLVPAGVALATLPRGQLLLLLGLVWIADSAAYFAGRAFGRRKLAPTISPGKTWEGVAGAAAGCLIYAIICAMSVPSLRAQIAGAVWVPYLLGAAALCAISVLGDLFESAVKRQAGAKDSGALLPGHGGVLDRIDAITAALPLGALLLRQLQPA
mgnify:CR=1 FL=1